jgi:hypothetical protein
MSKKNKKQPLLKRSKIRYYRKTIIWVSFLLVALYAISFWSSHRSMKVVNVTIEGSKFSDSQVIEDLFFETVSGKYFYLISRSNFLLLPKKTATKKIENLLEIDSVLIKKQDSNGVVIEVTEHEPVAEYCVESICYLVNDDGLIFVKKPEVFLDNLIVLNGEFLEEQDGEQNVDVLGEKFSNTETFQKLLSKIDLLIKENIEISSISTEDFETYTLQTVGGPVLLVEDQDTPETVVSNLKAALAQESIHKVQFNNIDYIDLRFEDKVFYKLK